MIRIQQFRLDTFYKTSMKTRLIFILSIISIIIIMGIFDIFGNFKSFKKQDNRNQAAIRTEIYNVHIPEEQFGVADFMENGMPHVACMNCNLLKLEPKEAFRWYLSVAVEIKNPNGYGMPVGNEVVDLQDFCDELDSKIKETTDHPNAAFLGRVTGEGFVHCMWYVNNPDKAHSLLQNIIENQNPTFNFEYEMTQDPDWSQAHYWLDH